MIVEDSTSNVKPKESQISISQLMDSFSSPNKQNKENDYIEEQQSPGTKILRYVQSQYYGQKGESKQLGNNIQEFCKLLMEENEKLEKENELLNNQSKQFSHIINSNTQVVQERSYQLKEYGQGITQTDFEISKMKWREKRIKKRDLDQDKDMDDLIEYVKWVTDDLTNLRERVRIAEKVISDLKKSGEESVESLLSSLYEQKKIQEGLDEEAENLKDIINTKEHEISQKEEEINRIKKYIEKETSEKELSMKAIQDEIQQINGIIENQQKIMKDLQMLNEITDNDMIRANKELSRRKQEQKNMLLKYNEIDHSTNTLRYRQSHLEDQVNTLRLKYGSLQQEEQLLEQSFQEKQHQRVRSQLAIFSIENKHLF